jgi:hypothetical protein
MMTNTLTSLNTSGPSTDEEWLASWTARAPDLEEDKVDEILELMGLL